MITWGSLILLGVIWNGINTIFWGALVLILIKLKLFSKK